MGNQKSNETITTTEKDLKTAVDVKATEKLSEFVEKFSDGITKSFEKVIEKIGEVKKPKDERIPIIAVKDNDVPNKLGRFAIAMVRNKINGTDFKTALDDLQISKYLNTSDLDAGGSIVPEVIADEIIQYLNNNAVVRKAGAGVLDMPNGNVKFPKFTTGVVGYWKGEATPTTSATPTTGSVSLSSKILAVDIPISNQLLRYSGNNTAREIQNLLLQGIVATEDKGFLNGKGSSYEPLGLSSQIASGNQIAATGSATGVQIKSDLLKLIKSLLGNNVPMLRPAWIMHPRDFVALQSQVDGSNNEMRYSIELQTNKTLFGYPVLTTNNVDIASDKTEIYLIDFSFVKIGQGKAIEVRFVENGSYYNGSAYVSGETTDESVFKASAEVDIALVNENAGAKLTGVGYGA